MTSMARFQISSILEETLTLCPLIPGRPGVPGNPRAPCDTEDTHQDISIQEMNCLCVVCWDNFPFTHYCKCVIEKQTPCNRKVNDLQ